MPPKIAARSRRTKNKRKIMVLLSFPGRVRRVRVSAPDQPGAVVVVYAPAGPVQ